jgi:hypothetical protein
METLEAKVTEKLASLTQWSKQSHGSPSLEKPSHSESDNSSYNMAFHSKSLPRDPRLL